MVYKHRFVYTTWNLSLDAKMAPYSIKGSAKLQQGILGDIESFDELAKFNISTQTKAIVITLRDLIGGITFRATEGKYFLLINGKTISLGHYPIENKRGSTEDYYPDLYELQEILTPDFVKQIIDVNEIAIACLTDGIHHWDYNFLKASSMFGGSFRAIGLQEEDGDVIAQGYCEEEYDSGYIASDKKFQHYHIMNDENEDLQKFSFVFNNLLFGNDNLKGDKNSLLTDLKKYNIEVVKEDHQVDREIMLAMVKLGNFKLKDTVNIYQCDQEIVLAAVKLDGMELEYASKDLKADREIVLAAVKQDGHALEYASEALRNDPEIVAASKK